MKTPDGAGQSTFRLILIKPSHYDDDGYVIQWLRSPIPANSLACLYGLARDARARDALIRGLSRPGAPATAASSAACPVLTSLAEPPK